MGRLEGRHGRLEGRRSPGEFWGLIFPPNIHWGFSSGLAKLFSVQFSARLGQGCVNFHSTFAFDSPQAQMTQKPMDLLMFRESTLV